MRIAIDCRKIRDGGIGAYLQNVLSQWQKRKMPAEFTLFHLSADRELFDPDFANLIAHDIRKYSVAELFSFSNRLREIRADIFYSPHYTLPFSLPCRAVITIHDLIHFRYPGKAGLLGKAYARYMVGHACKRADKILTDSRYSESEIVAHFPIAKNKIQTYYPAVDHEVFRLYEESEIKAYKKSIQLPAEFILYVGALKPHKNPTALAEVVNRLKLPLVIATRESTEHQKFISEKLVDKDLVTFVSVTDKRCLALLYNLARVLLHPSYLEGFGLPPLEAMACGLPVVCSDTASLPEVVGDAALTFAPDSYDIIAEKVNLCWRDDKLRNILRTKGVERAGLFDWGRTADGIFDSFIEVLGK